MFRGEVLGVMYHSWETYKKAWNDAVNRESYLIKMEEKFIKLYKEN